MSRAVLRLTGLSTAGGVGSKAGLNWTPMGQLPVPTGSLGSCGVPRGSSIILRDAETGEKHSQGGLWHSTAQWTKSRSGQFEAGAGQGGHPCPEPQLRLSSTSLCPHQLNGHPGNLLSEGRTHR